MYHRSNPQCGHRQLISLVGFDFLMRSKEHSMRRGSQFKGSLLLAGAISLSASGLACAHHYYRAYDPYYTDYHVWNGDEEVYYQRWAVENHHDPHRDFRRLPAAEQKEYWTWRHNHGDHDRDDRQRDHDHH